MKIPFDIKYRPQIESGEYNVETECGEPIEIVKWDCKGKYPILAVIDDGVTHDSCFYDESGTSYSGTDKIYVVIEEPEMAEFTECLHGLVQYLLNLPRSENGTYDNTGLIEDVVQNYKKELFEKARRQAESEDHSDPIPSIWTKREIECFMKDVDAGTERLIDDLSKHPLFTTIYEKGKRDALKDLPKWKQHHYQFCDNETAMIVREDSDLCVLYKYYKINLTKLFDMLPKED
jgi:hypothetical protein